MPKLAHAMLLLSPFLVSGCMTSHKELSPEVADFIQLLVQADTPTLAEYAQFSGECGGESELIFLLKECRLRGWSENSQACVDFTRQRCQMAEREPALALEWLRERFSTVGKSFQLISVRSEAEGFKHDLVEVKIGQNVFLLFHNTDPSLPTGTVVGVSAVNGKRTADYLESE